MLTGENCRRHWAHQTGYHVRPLSFRFGKRCGWLTGLKKRILDHELEALFSCYSVEKTNVAPPRFFCNSIKRGSEIILSLQRPGLVHSQSLCRSQGFSLYKFSDYPAPWWGSTCKPPWITEERQIMSQGAPRSDDDWGLRSWEKSNNVAREDDLFGSKRGFFGFDVCF